MWPSAGYEPSQVSCRHIGLVCIGFYTDRMKVFKDVGEFDQAWLWYLRCTLSQSPRMDSDFPCVSARWGTGYISALSIN